MIKLIGKKLVLLRKWFNKHLSYFGISYKHKSPPQSEEYKEYDNSNSDSLEIHFEYIKSLYHDESSRMGVIEGKTSQMVSQTSILFSLLGLFVPVFIDKLETICFLLKIILLLLLCSSFLFYLVAIGNALKNFNILKYGYSRPGANKVIEFKNQNQQEFRRMEIRAYLNGVIRNTQLNNIKGTNLIHAYRAFRIGNFMTAILVVLFCLVLLFP